MSMTVVVVLGLLWNKYLNKNTFLQRFEASQNQDVYLLGTFHETHFNKWVNYSMEDVLSVVENVRPDVVLLRRENDFLTITAW
ncbi:hypothetical protein NIE88_19040 [Sporolactobacillus shoreicorticis]|nr:hypothetical protein [Sporolactobacillus shoreicorticis]MCO7127847.1 hypothetical protein [Sporolactobacillus shoreicorticis]